MALDMQAARDFIEKDRAWRARNRTALAANPVLVCANCGWKIDQNSARQQGITACAKCGSRECRVHALDYVGGDKK